jgi:hypothetical protein
MQRSTEAIRRIPTDIFTKLWDCIRYRRLPHGLRLRKPSEEDDRKAVFGGEALPKVNKLNVRFDEGELEIEH